MRPGFLTAKHERTLAAIFADPIQADIRWGDVEALLLHLGAVITEARGSRVQIELSGADSTFHRPHPGKGATKPGVRSVRKFLIDAGHRP